ncbi:MAG TPA: histidine kinase [Pseudonocardia sp.]|nr:histidine kinase [Pseudonocardia sp.]
MIKRARVVVPGRRSWWVQLLSVVVPAVCVFPATPLSFAHSWAMWVGLGACALLPLRFWWPRLVLLACLPAVASGVGWAPAVVALYTLGRYTGRRFPTVPWIVVNALVATAAVVIGKPQPVTGLILAAVAAAAASAAPAAVGMLITTREQLQASLRDLEAAREATVAAREEVARAAERERIGREIHDAVGHHATMIAVGAAALAATSGDEQTRETAERLRVLAKRALAEMRAALGLLGTDSDLSSGLSALPDLVIRTKETGMHVDLMGAQDLGDDIPLGVERTIYRLVQESLTNAAKHAAGSDVEVRLERWATEIRVTITNTAPPRPKVTLPGGRVGGGLAGLAERIGMMGGRLRARPTSKGGFSVQGRLPAPPLDRDWTTPSVSPTTPSELTDPADSPLRDTKVATHQATKDGGAPHGVRAH